jgi:transposase
MSDTSSAITDLRTRWHALHDLDRASAVRAIHHDGMSVREIAAQLNCTHSLLYRLLRALKASPQDRARARRGELSTRELARRAGNTKASSPAKAHEAIAFENERRAIRLSKVIVNWFNAEGVSFMDFDDVIKVARIHLTKSGLTWNRTAQAAIEGLPIRTVIHRCRPAQPIPSGEQSVALYGDWLARWTLLGISDCKVRDRALDLAFGL